MWPFTGLKRARNKRCRLTFAKCLPCTVEPLRIWISLTNVELGNPADPSFSESSGVGVSEFCKYTVRVCVHVCV